MFFRKSSKARKGLKAEPRSRHAHARTVTTKRRKYVLKTGIRAPGGGSTAFIPVPLIWRATTRQMCGLFPWVTPGRLPNIGAPLGRHHETKAPICFDHISWFLARLISNPSVLIIARPGLGKSTLASKMMLWLAGCGYTLLIPGDTKPDYVKLTRKLGGEHRVISRHGGAALNPCDPGGMAAAARRIGGDAGASLLAETIGRATVCISTLVELVRRGPVADYEESTIAVALRRLYESCEVPPLLADVIELIRARPECVRDVVMDSGDDASYDTLTKPLLRSLRALLDGQFGDVFTRQVSRDATRPRAVNVDTSRIKGGDPRFLAAVMIAAWSDTYGLVEADQALADAELAPRRLYCLTLDELWRVLQLGGTMGSRVNELTRLNRTQGVGQIMITHSIRDLTPGRDNDIEGLEERAGAIIVGGVPKRELDALDAVMTMTTKERAAVQEWEANRQPALDQNKVPPGAGKFLLKPSAEDPGIPIQVVLTSAELAWGGQDTNEAWTAKVSHRPDLAAVDVDVDVDERGAA